MFRIRPLNHNGLVDADDCLARAPIDEGGCYLTSTPNAYDAPRAIRTRIDRPSQVMGIHDSNRYTERALLNYDAGRPYGRPDAAIGASFPNNAEITYYVDETIAKPFCRPNFGYGGGQTCYEDYTDPMDTWKPHWDYTLSCPEKVSPLSWINDSTFFRQDLMAKQMSVINQSRMENLIG